MILNCDVSTGVIQQQGSASPNLVQNKFTYNYFTYTSSLARFLTIDTSANLINSIRS